MVFRGLEDGREGRKRSREIATTTELFFVFVLVFYQGIKSSSGREEEGG
jgi:hypothetical protein